MKRLVKFRVRKGPIRVGNCVVMADHPDCIVVSLDCVSKYPAIDGRGDDDRHPFITLEATENTLDRAKGFSKKAVTRATFMELKGGGDVWDWYIFSTSEGGSYTIHISFLRRYS